MYHIDFYIYQLSQLLTTLLIWRFVKKDLAVN